MLTRQAHDPPYSWKKTVCLSNNLIYNKATNPGIGSFQAQPEKIDFYYKLMIYNYISIN